MNTLPEDCLINRINNYRNTCEGNDAVWLEFTQLANAVPFLKKHREYIESNELGFGDRAFHYMWYLLIKHLNEKGANNLDFLEIGIYKGQILSVWALISKELNINNINITGVSPLEGNFDNKGWFSRQLKKLSPEFVKLKRVGNAYENADYYQIIKRLFNHFELEFNKINLLKGYSNNPNILSQLSDKTFDLIYIDGDHSYNGVIQDLNNFLPKVKKGGFLIMDDASFSLPGSKFWKGHEEVSRATETIPGFGFKNILNVGHNRVYARLD